MPRPLKRSLQIVIATALTAGVVLFVMMVNAFLVGRNGTLGGIDVWLSFIRRSDIIGTIVLTALVTTFFLYWQRDRERR
jgi:membrane protein implicated in regulation of membrane protease activity